MTMTFSHLIDACMRALGDHDAAFYDRTTVVWPWAVEAMLHCPILRPQVQNITFATAGHTYDLTAGFRELITVEYPISQDPPEYLHRMNRLDPNFYTTDDHYDIDRNYVDGAGMVIWFSRKMQIGNQVTVNYLGNHDTDMADDEIKLITVPDEYVNILVADVVAKAYRERLGHFLGDPTSFTTIISELVKSVEGADAFYRDLVDRTMAKITDSRSSPHMQSDKYDRAY